jgi:hypothetical protein
VKTIGKGAFCECTGLTSITIRNSVKTIDKWAFRGCTSLRHIILSDNLKEIDDDVFRGCRNLNDIRYRGMTYSNIEDVRARMYTEQQQASSVKQNILSRSKKNNSR